jgi:hypothetical protein
MSAIIVLIMAASMTSGAAEFNLASETILRGFSRNSVDGQKHTPLPAYEYLNLDYGNLAKPGLSLHFNGWGRLNLADSANENNSAGELLQAYLQYVPPKQTYQLRVGRQYVFEGVARDSLDGVYGKYLAIPSVTLSAYAGVPVALTAINGRQGDLILGGKVTHSRPNLYDAGISYKLVNDNGSRREETFGADVGLRFPNNITLIGHNTFNLINNSWGEQSYDARIPFGPVKFQPFLQHFRYSSFLSSSGTTGTPFHFLSGTGNSLTVAGTDAFWYPNDQQEYVLRFKNYDYQTRFKTSQYYSLLATKRWKVLSETGLELGRMQGGDTENRYLLTRGYFYFSLMPGFITGDLMYVLYDSAIYGRNTSLFASIGVGRAFFDNSLNVKLSMDYSRDPYVNEDIRFMVKVDYRMEKSFNYLPPGNRRSGSME